ncbi:hypothetical protein [uncultured Limosilactobacillus sp.]|uniref:hypothetical protein n=1 Tax=uncultured Limosilactobacillus sp. TaxID=2837629 RepID=UPI0025D99BD2|nr:hypothetical protein [uncultured Limosilactobacillus sp.]
MTIEEAQQRMNSDQPVKYRDHLYMVLGINKLNNMVTIAQGAIGKDVKASELSGD